MVNLSRRVGTLAPLSRFGAIALAQQRIKEQSKIPPNSPVGFLFARSYTPLQKYAGYLYTLIYSEVMRK